MGISNHNLCQHIKLYFFYYVKRYNENDSDWKSSMLTLQHLL